MSSGTRPRLGRTAAAMAFYIFISYFLVVDLFRNSKEKGNAFCGS
jgi:hypothetical protein